MLECAFCALLDNCSYSIFIIVYKLDNKMTRCSYNFQLCKKCVQLIFLFFFVIMGVCSRAYPLIVIYFVRNRQSSLSRTMQILSLEVNLQRRTTKHVLRNISDGTWEIVTSWSWNRILSAFAVSRVGTESERKNYQLRSHKASKFTPI